MSVSRMRNFTSAARVRAVAEKYEQVKDSEVVCFLRDYADMIEEDDDENHVCLFNTDSENHCKLCGKVVTLTVNDLSNVLLLTPKSKLR